MEMVTEEETAKTRATGTTIFQIVDTMKNRRGLLKDTGDWCQTWDYKTDIWSLLMILEYNGIFCDYDDLILFNTLYIG